VKAALALGALTLVLGGCATEQHTAQPLPASPPPSVPGVAACTMDIKICADGSAVGRTAPDCEFAACPRAQPQSVD
jgi:hypothetical protein